MRASRSEVSPTKKGIESWFLTLLKWVAYALSMIAGCMKDFALATYLLGIAIFISVEGD